jgi:hypothetical protein
MEVISLFIGQYSWDNLPWLALERPIGKRTLEPVNSHGSLLVSFTVGEH